MEALVELGGRAEMSKVLDLVERKMRGILNDYDYQPLPSDPNTIRWRNTAQWCRNTMVREGLLKSDSPRGIWEISERGNYSAMSLRAVFWRSNLPIYQARLTAWGLLRRKERSSQ